MKANIKEKTKRSKRVSGGNRISLDNRAAYMIQLEKVNFVIDLINLLKSYISSRNIQMKFRFACRKYKAAGIFTYFHTDPLYVPRPFPRPQILIKLLDELITAGLS